MAIDLYLPGSFRRASRRHERDPIPTAKQGFRRDHCIAGLAISSAGEYAQPMCRRFTNHVTWQETHDLYDLTKDDFARISVPTTTLSRPKRFPLSGPMMRGTVRCRSCDGALSVTGPRAPSSMPPRNKSPHPASSRRPSPNGGASFRPTGFYEWKKAGDGKRILHRITLIDEQPFAFADIWKT